LPAGVVDFSAGLPALCTGGFTRRYITGMTLGIHLIWTTYGTWLPGDDRGHWSALFDLYGSIRERGGKLNIPDPETRIRAKSRMTETPKWLSPEEIAIVAEELGILLSPPNPPCWAATIESNHIHLLVGPVTEDIAPYAGRLKGRTSSEVGALSRNAGRERVWTSGYWKVFLFDEIAVTAVKRYIDTHNTRRGLPAEPYSWITHCPYVPAGKPAAK
jgi:hypothetical protein